TWTCCGSGIDSYLPKSSFKCALIAMLKTFSFVEVIEEDHFKQSKIERRERRYAESICNPVIPGTISESSEYAHVAEQRLFTPKLPCGQVSLRPFGPHLAFADPNSNP